MIAAPGGVRTNARTAMPGALLDDPADPSASRDATLGCRAIVDFRDINRVS
jgi:hypothetical protein